MYQYEDDKDYDDHRDQREAPSRFYDRYFRRCHGKTRSDPEVIDEYSEELRDVLASAVETAWKYLIRDARSRLPLPCPNDM